MERGLFRQKAVALRQQHVFGGKADGEDDEQGNDAHQASKISLFVFFPVLFSGGLVPYYVLLVKVLNIKNTIWALIAAGVVSPMNVSSSRWR